MKIIYSLKNSLLTSFILFSTIISSLAQESDSLKIINDRLDSIYINEFERKDIAKIKVLHAEPLYIDLIRDLGARKGEKEWNVGLGIADKQRYNEYIALVEYEWAPIDRVGLEVELPFSVYSVEENVRTAPNNKLNSLKVAGQYSFFVSDKINTSMALGYIHEFELTDFESYGKQQLISGFVYNPFFIAAKRWGQNFHTLLYTGPQVFQHFEGGHFNTIWQVNSNIHYMIDGTRNFIGLEINKEFTTLDTDITFRPQMRVALSDQLMVGIVTGIPILNKDERLSTFLRLIYEPGHKGIYKH